MIISPSKSTAVKRLDLTSSVYLQKFSDSPSISRGQADVFPFATKLNIIKVMSTQLTLISSAVCSSHWWLWALQGSSGSLMNTAIPSPLPLLLWFHRPSTLQQKSAHQPRHPFVPHTAIQRVLNLYLENVNGITHGEPYNFIISRSFCSLHGFHEGPSALMALG